MKNAPDRKATESAIPEQNSAIFSYPQKPASACAEVLARLLAGEVLTSVDTLEQCSTMRAAAHVGYLKTRYGWAIEGEPRAVGCTDGRCVEVASYRLPSEVIQAARAAGASRWIAQVKQARAALRARAAAAYRRAAAMNRARRKAPPPGQGDLFGEEGAQ